MNPFITERLQKTYPRQKEKIDTLWTWVNTDIFKPQPLPKDMEPFRIVFAGRLDEFKDPPLMFDTINRLRQLMPGGVEFNYIGTSDPHRFEEFAKIEDITVRHGFMDAAGMASTIASVHAGILTSEFEGMPRFVLETLAVGRPVVAMHLPQLESAVRDGESGFLVPRSDSAWTWLSGWRIASSTHAMRSRLARWNHRALRAISGRSRPEHSSHACFAITRKSRTCGAWSARLSTEAFREYPHVDQRISRPPPAASGLMRGKSRLPLRILAHE